MTEAQLHTSLCGPILSCSRIMSSTEQYLERAHKFGVFPKQPKLFLPNDEIEAVYRLGALRPE